MGGATTSLQRVWTGMRYRCRNPNSGDYPNYGGRGITICPEWDIYLNFWQWALPNGYKVGLYLDRIDNDAGYSPENCRFVTSKVSMNNRRSLRNITAFGETKNVTQWSEDARCLVSRATVYQRLDIGWQPEQALTLPNGTRKPINQPQQNGEQL